MKNKQKRRWSWNKKHVRKHTFQDTRSSYDKWFDSRCACKYEHNQRRRLEKTNIKKIISGIDESLLYFPTKWEHVIEYY